MTEETFAVRALSETDRALLTTLVPADVVELIEAHRGLKYLDPAKPDDYMLYTGRGPSQGSFHIGHLVGLRVVKALQRALGSKTFFMIADDEKMFRDGIDAGVMASNVDNTLRQLRAMGFTDEDTTFHINSRGLSEAHYRALIQLMNAVTVNQLTHVFGPKTNLGELFYPLYQILPCFLGKQAIVVAGRDQDPFFRLAYAVAKRMGPHKPPILLYTRAVPGLDGTTPKMSTSVPSSLPIFLTDTPSAIGKKIKDVKRVGAGSLDELFDRGADLAKDTLYDLAVLFETDKEALALVTTAYTQGVPTDSDLHCRLVHLVGAKGVASRGGRTMLLTSGLRVYVTCVVVRAVHGA